MNRIALVCACGSLDTELLCGQDLILSRVELVRDTTAPPSDESTEEHHVPWTAAAAITVDGNRHLVAHDHEHRQAHPYHRHGHGAVNS